MNRPIVYPRLSLAKLILPGFVLTAFSLSGCSSSTHQMRKLPSGDYELTCDSTLRGCLEAIEQRCGRDGYNVLVGGEKRAYAGPQELESVNVESYALARCRRGQAVLLGDAADRWPPAPASRKAETETVVEPKTQAEEQTPKACIPGATQACVGPGGCQGGQVCLPDGNAFGACDCTPPQPSEAQAAPEPTEPSSESQPEALPPADAPTEKAPAP